MHRDTDMDPDMHVCVHQSVPHELQNPTPMCSSWSPRENEQAGVPSEKWLSTGPQRGKTVP